MRVSQICRRSAAVNFGRKTFTGNRTDTKWSSTTFKGKISVSIVVFKFYALCYLRTIRLKQENFPRNNNTNYTRRHKFITHRNNCCQVFSRSRNDQLMFVNEVFVAKNIFSGFRRAKREHLFSKSKPYSTTSHEHVKEDFLKLEVNFKTLLPLFRLSFH